MKFAQETYKLGLYEEFSAFTQTAILTVTSRPQHYVHQQQQYCRLLNSVAAHALEQARTSSEEAHVKRATEVLNLAARAVKRDPLTHVHKGL